MTVVYKCSECGKEIDKLVTNQLDEAALGINILTEEERKDIIETTEDTIVINITCDQCIKQQGINRLYNSYIH